MTKWVKVKDKLPKEHFRVIVDGEYFSCSAEYSEKHGWEYHGESHDEAPIYWAEWPKSPDEISELMKQLENISHVYDNGYDDTFDQQQIMFKMIIDKLEKYKD